MVTFSFLEILTRNENVVILKDAIKLADEIAFILYNVSIPHSPKLAEHAATLKLDELELNALDKLSKVFANGLLDTRVNVVVEIPQAYGAWVYVILWSLR
jgi:hypothetical protein